MLIRSFVGVGHHEELVSFGDKELLRAVLEELGEIAGILANAGIRVFQDLLYPGTCPGPDPGFAGVTVSLSFAIGSTDL
ncbi:MAG: hypothetical protein Q7J12_07420 [Syntrophales bacterium]|nr:hypothetical protein [Syntrophales bacterium]